MRKSLILFLLLLILCTGITCYANYAVNANKDTLTLSEQVIYGDKSVAEGITIDLRTHYNDQLFWDTTYTVGQKPSIETDFSFSYIPAPEEYLYTPQGVELNSVIDPTTLGIEEKNPTGMAKAYQELFEDITPGTRNSKIIYVKDYLENYPIAKNLDFSTYALYWGEFDENYDPKYLTPLDRSYRELFDNFFTIPVLETETYEITIEMDKDGNIFHSSGSYTESDFFNLYTINTMTEDACFFTFDTHTTQGNIIDTSKIPGGYGIYRLLRPTSATIKNNTPVSSDALSMVYPLDPEIKLMNLTTTPDKTCLLLFTTYRQRYYMTVIDATTFETLQEIEIASFTGDEAIWNTYIYDDFLVAELSDHRLALLTVTENGDYQLEFVADTDSEKLPVYHMYRRPSMDWNGEQLVISGIMNKDYIYEATDFYLAVYDKTGLRYWGEYENSLSTGYSDTDSYSYYCHPVDKDPLVVRWGR